MRRACILPVRAFSDLVFALALTVLEISSKNWKNLIFSEILLLLTTNERYIWRIQFLLILMACSAIIYPSFLGYLKMSPQFCPVDPTVAIMQRRMFAFTLKNLWVNLSKEKQAGGRGDVDLLGGTWWQEIFDKIGIRWSPRPMTKDGIRSVFEI